MKAIFEKNTLLGAVTPALGSVSGKNTLPAIEGVNLDCSNPGRCVVTAYDLEKGFRCTIECEVEKEGNYIVNGQKLCQILSRMPGSFVTIEVNDKDVVTISSGKIKFELHALNGRDFPMLPELDGDHSFEIRQSTFRSMLEQTEFAIAQNNMRPELNGAFFKTDGSKLTIVASDGHKLALCERAVELRDLHNDGGDISFSFIVPGKILFDLGKAVADSDEPMVVKYTYKHVFFYIGNSIFFSRLIDAEYIDYNRFIPKTGNIFVTVDAQSLTNALECAMLVTEDRTLGQARSVLKCTFTGNMLMVSSTSVTSRVSDEIFTEKIGPDIEIGFNCRYLLEAMHACDAEKIKLTLSGPLMSMVIEPADPDPDKRFTFLIVPVKM